MKSNLRMLTAALSASAFATAALAQDLGSVHFKTSCTPQAQEKFDRGVTLVHSFYYPDSIQAFTEAAAADPQCAIAYWGVAISHRPNPLVLPLAAAALKNGLEAVEKGKAIGAKTERERDWIAAIEVYYKDHDKIDQTTRGLAYERAMEQLAQKYPDDMEATIFYALSLNETALPSDKTYAKLLKAAPSSRRSLRRCPITPASCITSSTATTMLRWHNAASMPPTDMPRWRHRRRTRCTCRRISIPCSDCGRSRSNRTPDRRRSAASRRPRPGPARHIRSSHIGWISWHTPCCRWARKGARSSSSTTTARSRSSDSNTSWATPGSRRFPRASRSSAKRGRRRPGSSHAAASSRKPRRSPTLPARSAWPAAGTWPRPSRTWPSSRSCARRWKRQISHIGPSKLKSRRSQAWAGSPTPRDRRTKRSNSCAPRPTWKMPAKSTSPWRIGSTRCASSWATCCWRRGSTPRR